MFNALCLFCAIVEVVVICCDRPNTVLFMTSSLRTFVTGEIAHILSYSVSYLEGSHTVLNRASELCLASTENVCVRSWAHWEAP